METASEIVTEGLKRRRTGTIGPEKHGREKGIKSDIFEQRVEKKAYEIYQDRGCQDGHDCDDWLEAEKIVEAEMIAGK
jgi:hypothetical protein